MVEESVSCTPEIYGVGLAIFEGKDGTEDPNQNLGLAKEHIDSEVARIGNPVDILPGMSHHLFLARLFPWNFALKRGEHQLYVHSEDLDDIREMQELAFARNASKTKARTGQF